MEKIRLIYNNIYVGSVVGVAIGGNTLWKSTN